MHRFYAPPETCAGDVIHLDAAEAHHAHHVLRVRTGEEVTVLNGVGTIHLCRVTSSASKQVQLQVMERRQTAPPPCRITLYQAIPKGKTFDAIIHKATELGVNRIVPIITEHVIARPEEGELSRKESKWQATTIEATKQCGQPWLPQVTPPRKLLEVLRDRDPAELELIGALLPGSTHPRSAFNQFQTLKNRKPLTAAVWIGPEGDFTREEIAAITASGAVPITLGPLVLKCETAATYTLSILSYEVTG